MQLKINMATHCVLATGCSNYRYSRLKTLAGSCSRSSTETVGSNPNGGMDVFLLWILCIVRQRSLRRTDHSSRGVLPSVVCRCVWSRNLRNGPRWASKNYGTIYRPKFASIKCEHRESQEPPCLRRTVISNTTQSMGVVSYPCKATWRVDISYKLFLFYFRFLFVFLTLYIVQIFLLTVCQFTNLRNKRSRDTIVHIPP